LPYPSAKANGTVGHTVEKHPRRGGIEKHHNPIPEMGREAPLLKKINKVSPKDRVEGFPDVKLEK
jgi:hypothetical protein